MERWRVIDVQKYGRVVSSGRGSLAEEIDPVGAQALEGRFGDLTDPRAPRRGALRSLSNASRIRAIAFDVSCAGPSPKLSPIQPKPISDTSSPLVPSLRVFLTVVSVLLLF
jgi:hypothetical protein